MIEHTTETSPTTDSVEVYNVSYTYQQGPDNYQEDSIDQYLTIGTEPGGYFYIKTDRWAFDSAEELLRVLNDFINKIQFAE